MQAVTDMLRGALGLHQQGRLAEAEQLYTKVLQADAKQFDALHLLGLLKHQRGDSAQALPLIEAALKANPGSVEALMNYGGVLSVMNRHADALAAYDRAVIIKSDRADVHYNRGNALMALQRYADALGSYDRALALKPNDPLALYNRANALAGLNRSEEALAAYDKVLALAPKHPDALINRGKALKNLNRAEEALACFDRVLAIQPNNVLAHINRGSALKGLNRWEEALAAFDRSLELQPEDVGALNERGTVLLRLYRYEQALECYDKALALAPGDTNTINNRGTALLPLNRHDEALACFDRVLELKPDHIQALNNRGNVLVNLNRLEEALACFDRLLEMRPDDVDMLHNRGNVLRNLDRYDEALACFERARQIQPDHAESHWNSGITMLAAGDFGRGWQAYEWRWKTANFLAKPRHFREPRWDGSYVKGTLFIWGEQGIGDEVLYANMIPDLAGHADAVVVEAEPRLAGLFARSFPAVRVIARGEPLPENIVAQSPLPSLGQYLRTSWQSFPRREHGYLVADAEKTASLRRRLSPQGETIVGLSWISTNPSVGKLKTASLRDFEPVLRLPGCRFVDLQYGDTQAERAALKETTGLTVERLQDIDNTNDLDSLAALMAACDLVVTVSNTTAHLAGALGKPTIVFVPFGQARFWYWFKDASNSPWYPRVTIKRAMRGQSWRDLIVSAAGEIAQTVTSLNAR